MKASMIFNTIRCQRVHFILPLLNAKVVMDGPLTAFALYLVLLLLRVLNLVRKDLVRMQAGAPGRCPP